MQTVTQTSVVGAPPAAVWTAATSLDGINAEMAPWLAMTMPEEAPNFTIDDALGSLGEPLFSSRVLLFGRLPVERMDVTIIELEPGRRFVEQSRMQWMRYWRHERLIEPAGGSPGRGGTRVTDMLTFEPPIAAVGPVLRRVASAFFAHRHPGWP